MNINFKLISTILLAVTTLISCNSPITESYSNDLDTLYHSSTVEESKTEYVTLLEDSTKIIRTSYPSSWLSKELGDTVELVYTNRPKPDHLLTYQLFIGDSLAFKSNEIQHGVYKNEGNCLFINRREIVDSMAYQYFTVLGPAWADSMEIALTYDKGQKTLIPYRKLKSARSVYSNVIEYNYYKYEDYELHIKLFFHASKETVEFKRAI